MACVTCHQKKVKCVFQGSNDCCDRCLSNRLCCEPHKSQQGRRTDLAEESLAKRVHISSPLGCSEPIESDFSNDVEVLGVFCQGETTPTSQQGQRTDLAEDSLSKRVHISSPSGCSEPVESDFSNDVEVLDVFCQGERG